ncbi:hypothetical protein HDG32_003361 [Paraburkholderia sp. CI2]|uniref:hypothetical protein n=1 Tax=Paraburkholderia sp. CI2 TaxID=2723093 RepID=UPI0017D85F93|nr:hypothetical protein [Paraburkholderia sp. CI2]MBB5467241.1 hypothetical protein [Paraburkholderia sp. CI2]
MTELDAAVIRVDQLQALASLLSLEEVAEQFAGLSNTAQVALFGLFEDGLGDVRATLVRGMEAAHG